MLDACAGCGEAHQLVGFDLRHGGALCAPCTQLLNAPRVSPEALAIVARVLTGDLVGVLNQPLEPASVEVDRLATHSFEHHLERRLRAVRVLDRA
jgi:recombinational DNA repair protein (RecF pathway)